MSERDLIFGNKDIFDSIPIPVGIISLESKVVHANKALSSFLGYSETELQGMRFTNFTDHRDVYSDSEEFEKLVRGEQDSYSFKKRYDPKFGKKKWGLLHTKAFRIDGELKYVIGYIIPIQDDKQITIEGNVPKKDEEAVNKVFNAIAKSPKITMLIISIMFAALIYTASHFLNEIDTYIRNFLTK